MRILYSIMAMAMVWSVAQGQTWTNIATDPSGDSQGLDATGIDYWYDDANDEVQFRITTMNLSNFSTGPAADFSFQLPNGLDGGQATGTHWTTPGTPVHKTGYVYCDAGGSAPSNYTFVSWPIVVEVTSDPSVVLCSNCISVNVDVPNNEMIYTFSRQDIITDTEMGGSSATILLVANAGHDVGWDDNITSGDPFTLNLTTSVNELADEGSVSIYPNPVEGLLSIEAPNLTGAELIDVTGKHVAAFTNRISDLLTLDVAEQPAGMYFVNLQFANRAPITSKVMIR